MHVCPQANHPHGAPADNPVAIGEQQLDVLGSLMCLTGHILYKLQLLHMYYLQLPWWFFTVHKL